MKFRRGILIAVLIVLIQICSVLAQNSLDEEESISFEGFVYESEANRDPFFSLLDNSGVFMDEQGPKKEEILMERVQKVSVNGVIWDQDMPLVMINKKIYKKGDMIQEGLLVKEIRAESVTLGYEDLTHVISLVKRKNLD
ncbi:MAG: general secretion pathway protein GspB [Candidatus Omnitrophica bacterium]|nr:general secretion pathway protein GspB [Candidatus Omnitrophota bacterium]